MKSTLFSRIIFATLVLAFATSAFAASDSHKSSFADFRSHTSKRHNAARRRIHRTVGRLRANVQVNIMQGKKVVATAPAQVIPLDSKASDTQAEVLNGTNGERELKALQFAGKKFSLQLGTESAKAQSKTASTN